MYLLHSYCIICGINITAAVMHQIPHVTVTFGREIGVVRSSMKGGGLCSLVTSLFGDGVHHVPGPCPPTVILALFLELETGRGCDLSPSLRLFCLV